MRAKCSRCHKNPVQRPAYICGDCLKAPKRRRTNRATARPSYLASGGAAGVIQRSTSAAAPVASTAWYDAQPVKTEVQ